MKLNAISKFFDLRNSNILTRMGKFNLWPQKMIHHFKILPFMSGIVIGLLFIFYYKAPQTTIYEYPHPHNVNNRVYRDKNGVCYSYNAKEVNCDANEETLREYPIQG